MHSADEGAGCLKRLEVIDKGGEMRDSTEGWASVGLPDHEHVLTRSGPREVTRMRSRRGRAGEGNELTREVFEERRGILGGA